MVKTAEKDTFKVGTVAMVGRPNVGKSTLLNAIVGQKVTIVSPKAQTTRAVIEAYTEDERGQIFFMDTPGYFRTRGNASPYNTQISESLKEADLILYVVDHTRRIGDEELRLWRAVKDSAIPIIIALNKIDQANPSYEQDYRDLMEADVQVIQPISALEQTHIKGLVQLMFTYLPEGERQSAVDYFPTPLMSQSSSEFLSELLREKIFNAMGQEIPYNVVPEIYSVESTDETLSISGKIKVPNSRYKSMLIGKGGTKIRSISGSLQKELKVATGKDVQVKIRVKEE